MKPQPIWERWIKNPKNREKFYYLWMFIVIGVNIFIALGFILFIVFFYLRSQ